MEMAYSNRFAVCVLVNNQIMKELPDGSVGLPFGTEYTLRLFNKHDRRAVAKVFLDTENVSGGGFIIPPLGKIDIDRRADRDTAFKFVELGSDEAIADGKPYTNESREMGLVEVHFHLEKERPQPRVVEHHHHHHHDWWRPWYYGPYWTYGKTYSSNMPRGLTSGSSGISGSSGTTGSSGRRVKSSTKHTKSLSDSSLSFNATNDVYSCGISGPGHPGPQGPPGSGALNMVGSKTLSDGCTVEGRETGTVFRTEYVDIESNSTILKLFLQGFKQSVSINVAQ